MGLYSNRRLPDWPEEGTESSLRDADEEYPTAPLTSQAARRIMGGGTGSSFSTAPDVLLSAASSSITSDTSRTDSTIKNSWKDLDEFYASEGEDVEEESEEESDDSSIEQVPEAGDPSHSEDRGSSKLHEDNEAGDSSEEDA